MDTRIVELFNRKIRRAGCASADRWAQACQLSRRSCTAEHGRVIQGSSCWEGRRRVRVMTDASAEKVRTYCPLRWKSEAVLGVMNGRSFSGIGIRKLPVRRRQISNFWRARELLSLLLLALSKGHGVGARGEPILLQRPDKLAGGAGRHQDVSAPRNAACQKLLLDVRIRPANNPDERRIDRCACRLTGQPSQHATQRANLLRQPRGVG